MKTVITILVDHKEPLPYVVANTITDRLADLTYNQIAQHGKTAEVTASLALHPGPVWEVERGVPAIHGGQAG